MNKHERGLYRKFDVHRTDGTDAPGQKHDGCNYFVLDVTHDQHALPALRAYAESCKTDYPALSADVADLAGPALSSSIQPRTEPRLIELATQRADQLHWMPQQQGHSQPLKECQHPDCVLVRASLQPPASAQPTTPIDLLDGEEVRATLHSWARSIRLAETQQELLDIADDMDINCGRLSPASAVSPGEEPKK
jgi:hypothetical protein